MGVASDNVPHRNRAALCNVARSQQRRPDLAGRERGGTGMWRSEVSRQHWGWVVGQFEI
jgi:hypothetical protein